MGKHPQVLLIGNGVNRAYGGIDWNALLARISGRDVSDITSISVPFPFKAILATEDNLKEAIASHGEELYGEIKSGLHRDMLSEILMMGFDDILTTNYSYELEESALGLTELHGNQIKKIKQLLRYTKDHAENQYFLHTYNEVICGGVTNRIWHIHGESRKQDSMVLGHYWYGNQLFKIKDVLYERKNAYSETANNRPIIDRSWVDSFILGDVYVLGFGFDLSEIDLWWLLNRKLREKGNHGKVIFYEPKDDRNQHKIELLKLMKVQHESFEMENVDNSNPTNNYINFYKKAIEDIREQMASNHD